MHVHGDDRLALRCREPQQGLPDQQCHLHLLRRVGYRRAELLIELDCGANSIAPQTVSASVHNDTVQPAAHRGIVAEEAGTAVRAQHRVLYGVVGVLVGRAAAPGHAVELIVMAAEQLAECAPVAGGMGGEEIGIAGGGDCVTVGGKTGIVHGADSSHSGPDGHFTRVDGRLTDYGAALTLISETSVRLLPAV